MSTADAVVTGLVLAVAGAVVGVVARLGAQRRLRRQGWVGIRLPQTMKSDNAWYAAHAAAAPMLMTGAAAAVVSGLGSAVAGAVDADAVANGLVFVGIAGLVAFALAAMRPAVQAARREP